MPSEDAKALKKEDADEDNQSLSSFARKKPTNANNGSSSTKLKKENEDDDDDDKPIKASLSGSRSKAVKKKEIVEDDDEKPISKRNSSVVVSKEKELKKKKKKEAEKEVKIKREKKVYDLPGQKKDTPEERDPLRIFYESLYKQVPTSEMAQIWLMESGLLPAEKAKKVLEKKLQKTAKSGKINSPAKSAASSARTTCKSVTAKNEVKPSPGSLSAKKKASDSKPIAKKRKKDSDEEDEDSDDDFLVNRVAKKARAK